MNQVTIDGKIYNLVPAETNEQEKELLICELNGAKYFLGPEAPEEMTWKEAIAWCKSLGEGHELPSRIVLLACFMNPETKPKFKELWYWSDTEFDAAFAWYQHFGNGHQNGSSKNGYGPVRAVRKVIILEDLK